jgi:hypothetical protein
MVDLESRERGRFTTDRNEAKAQVEFEMEGVVPSKIHWLDLEDSTELMSEMSVACSAKITGIGDLHHRLLVRARSTLLGNNSISPIPFLTLPGRIRRGIWFVLTG